MSSAASEISRNIVITVFSVLGSVILASIVVFLAFHFFVKQGGLEKLMEWIFTK